MSRALEVTYDDSLTKLGPATESWDVQAAIEALVARIQTLETRLTVANAKIMRNTSQFKTLSRHPSR